MSQTIVLTGTARSKGKVKAEAMVFSHRFGWAFNHVGNEDGKILTAGWDHLGESVEGKIVIYPTVTGSTSGAVSLYYKCKQSMHGPAAIKHLLQGSLAYAGFSVLPPYVGWHVPYISHEARSEVLAQWHERLANLDSLSPLKFPELA
jgi:predicted aconitase with swiveling domain